MNPNLRRRLKYVAPLVVKKVSFENLDRKYVGLEHIESWTGRILYDDLTTHLEGTVSLFEPALLHGSDNSRKPPLPVIQAMRFV